MRLRALMVDNHYALLTDGSLAEESSRFDEQLQDIVSKRGAFAFILVQRSRNVDLFDGNLHDGDVVWAFGAGGVE
eukprot:9344632-Karenia_brevis.AAC.1